MHPSELASNGHPTSPKTNLTQLKMIVIIIIPSVYTSVFSPAGDSSSPHVGPNQGMQGSHFTKGTDHTTGESETANTGNDIMKKLSAPSCVWMSELHSGNKVT